MLSSSSSAGRLVPTAMLLPPFARTPTTAVVELPVSIAAGCQRQKEIGCSSDDMQTPGSRVKHHTALPVYIETQVPCGSMPPQHGLIVRSPSSPSSFVTQSEVAEFGLTPLIEAAEQVGPLIAHTPPPLHGRPSTLKRSLLQTLPSIVQAMNDNSREISPMPKRSCFGSHAGPNVQAAYTCCDHPPVQGFFCSTTPQQRAQHWPNQRVKDQHVIPRVTDTIARSPSSAETKSVCAQRPLYMRTSVWEVVLATDVFPTDICLSAGAVVDRVSPRAPHMIDSRSKNLVEFVTKSAVKQSRRVVDDEGYDVAILNAVKSDTVLPPNVSVENLADDKSPYKPMRVSGKSPSLTSIPCYLPEQGSVHGTSRDKAFDPLSLRSIMNNESTGSPYCDASDLPESIASSYLARHRPGHRTPTKSNQQVLKRSDYSQHGIVRSGRWSMEEELYAKAMIEAFKSGFLPLHGNMSLRKFLSEVLVCHPMRISKKFVGYVRKYHWYRIASGKCDPKAKRQVLCELSRLERAFWISQQQSSEWLSGLRQDD
ncbi:unnamed protein product [Hyaloperonospora brassicae]|uniref:Uncharacterized protein n=1 Tax=Hyaloperonospora brassicae TaxID=162125 RepID=A0AAV0U6J8_HYABA|nr:unnamed protein product [Hyaloperonospora brassicae]